ncbi:MAG: N-acetylmuramoyl-L-alanine amidase-like domain-containing protein, partial [Verrucomicrobiota bacterium]
MPLLSRRCFFSSAGILFAPPLNPTLFSSDSPTNEKVAAVRPLPMSTIFKGEDRFHAIVKKASEENWRELPIGERIIKCARELHGLPYENFTLEIDDHIESPSVNLEGLDCWTFFEQAMGLARMISIEKEKYTPEDLLREIEFTRYRGGVCTGNYLERIHYLAEWFFENEARGTCRHLTPELTGAERIHDRRISEMTVLWKSYRYLKNNPELREPMAEWEARVAAMPVYHIPKAKVPALEPQLQNGDVIGIATKHHGGFCSHVGLAIRTDDGVTRFMHASRNYRKVVIDKSVSGYLNQFSSHAGILVGRPLEVSETV